MDCCPAGISNLSCAAGWEQATFATADYFNTCGLFPPFIPLPLPDGEGLIGCIIRPNSIGNTYLETLGTCLSQPLIAGQSYTLTFHVAAAQISGLVTESHPLDYNALQFTLFGKETCPTFPVTTNGCVDDWGWDVISHLSYTPDPNWSELTVTFTPATNFEAFILSGRCNFDMGVTSLPAGHQAFVFLDNFRFAATVVFENDSILVEGGDCLSDKLLTAPAADAAYQWYLDGVAFVGETDQVLNLGSDGYLPGTYTVRVSPNGIDSCYTVYTEIVASAPAPFEFTADFTLGCAPLTVDFNLLMPSNTFENVTWQYEGVTSTDPNPNHTFASSGNYSVAISVTTPGGCVFSGSLAGGIEVLSFEAPIINSLITKECEPFELELSTVDGSTNCVWQIADDPPELGCTLDMTIPEPGIYTVSLSTNEGTPCALATNIQLVLENKPKEIIRLESQDFICPNDSVEIRVVEPFEAGSYFWSNGAQGDTIYVFDAADYLVTYIDTTGCESDTSILITGKQFPLLTVTDSLRACEGQVYYLSASSPNGNVSWQGITDRFLAEIRESGAYTAMAENECGVQQETIDVFFDNCRCDLLIPNIFTPNSDGKNDFFQPEIDCVHQNYSLTIFDRWGKEIFRSSEGSRNWDGTVAQTNLAAQEGTYWYLLEISDSEFSPDEKVAKQGVLQLLR